MPTTHAQRRIHDAAIKLFAQQNAQQISMSELASAAGVSRGTVYNHIDSTSSLFEQIASNLAIEMNQRISASTHTHQDPALSLAYGIRLYIQRSSTEPDWGLFVATHGVNKTVLGQLWAGEPAKHLRAGLQEGRFSIEPGQMMSTLALLGSAVIAGIHLSLAGMRTWSDAGSDVSELLLRALGLDANEARLLARAPMPNPTPLSTKTCA